MGTFCLFVVMALINPRWVINISTIVVFVLIYVIIWLICLLEQKKTVNRINDRIKKRNLK
ncbi:hypothetical protein FC44_GL000342 [Lactobacillus intestinalis DSM 6629]|uniref:Uncharacterized protein n=1 Tax=Lactobacillus intestinalis DSM 6629 TaxID=1423761 RepID=A0ABR5PRL4_9LACO|nr:hypothetical protein FC44_GL000342 [Lactobacillus intestinalis DSM 6629]